MRNEIREEVRNFTETLETAEEIDNFEEEGPQIIEELVAALKTDKYMLPIVKNVHKKKLLEEAVNIDKILESHIITKTNVLFYTGERNQYGGGD